VLPQSASAAENTLYERLGGYDAVSAVVDDFAAKLFTDKVVGKRFFGMSDDSRQGFRQKNKNLVCKVTGGPCKVISRPAKVTHGGLGIKATEFNIVVGHLVDTLNKFNVPAKEQKELLVVIGTLRPGIVEIEDE
jgi:hemoglobin